MMSSKNNDNNNNKITKRQSFITTNSVTITTHSSINSKNRQRQQKRQSYSRLFNSSSIIILLVSIVIIILFLIVQCLLYNQNFIILNNNNTLSSTSNVSSVSSSVSSFSYNQNQQQQEQEQEQHYSFSFPSSSSSSSTTISTTTKQFFNGKTSYIVQTFYFILYHIPLYIIRCILKFFLLLISFVSSVNNNNDNYNNSKHWRYNNIQPSSYNAAYLTINKTNNNNNNNNNNKNWQFCSCSCSCNITGQQPGEQQQQQQTQNHCNNITYIQTLFTIDNYCLHRCCSNCDNNNKQRQELRQGQEQEQEQEQQNHSSYTTDGDGPESTNGNIQQQEQRKEDDTQDKLSSIVIIGGTDGSGTRVFASILQNLFHINMLIDDTTTMDINARILFSTVTDNSTSVANNSSTNNGGWPALVRYILNYTRSANYTFDTDLPIYVQQRVLHEMNLFRTYYENRRNNVNRNVNITKQLPSLSSTTNTNIQYGFKAPISMMLLPILQKVYSKSSTKIKYIHIVRDGRDICYSTNQSPVNKFFPYSYPSNVVTEKIQYALSIIDSITKQHRQSSSFVKEKSITTLQTILSMNLWNDWNMQVYNYLLQQQKQNDNQFDSIIVRVEDLIVGTKETKFATLFKIASFLYNLDDDSIIDPQKQDYNTGSTTIIQSICKYIELDSSILDNDWKGQQQRQQKQKMLKQRNIQQRYGKWKVILQNELPIVSTVLHTIGTDALATFGYEPYRLIEQDLYYTTSTYNNFCVS